MFWIKSFNWWDKHIVGFCHKRRWIWGHDKACRGLMFFAGRVYKARKTSEEAKEWTGAY